MPIVKPPENQADRAVALVCGAFYPQYGGPGIAFLRLAPRLKELGLRLTVLSRRAPGVAKREERSCLTILRFGGARARRLNELRFIAGVLWHLAVHSRRYHCIHVFYSGWVTFFVPLLGRLLGKRTSFTMTLLDSDDPENLRKTARAWLKLPLFRLYDPVIYINPEQARRYERVYGTTEPLIAGSMGIDVETFRPPTPRERLAARRELDLEEGALVAAFSGSLTHRKGIDRAVEVWLKIAEARPDARFVILGPQYDDDQLAASLYPALMDRIKASGKEGNFRFLWSRPDIQMVLRLLHAADLFLFPSRVEGTPSAVMEAMACGVVPVVAPLDGFTGVVVRDEVEGLVLDPGAGMDEWAGRVLRLLDDGERLRELAARSRKRVMETHSQEIALEALKRAWGMRWNAGEEKGATR